MKKHGAAPPSFCRHSGGSSFADSPKSKTAPRFPQIPDDRITAAEAAERMKELAAAWPYSIENYLKNLKRIQKEL